jgi:hypothetical protein
MTARSDLLELSFFCSRAAVEGVYIMLVVSIDIVVSVRAVVLFCGFRVRTRSSSRLVFDDLCRT